VIINTGGGLASGDQVIQSFDVGEDAALTVTTQAAERSYRSDDAATTRMDVTANIGDSGSLIWLPQETILFDCTRFSRSITVDTKPTSRALVAETVVFGRAAMGEKLANGFFADTWRIRRDDRLIFAENIKLDDTIFEDMATAAVNGDAHVAMMLVYVADDAEDLLIAARNVISDAPVHCAASSWNGMLVVRGLARRSEDVRHLMARLIPALKCGLLPRVWWT
jgi:urease accessory protein